MMENTKFVVVPLIWLKFCVREVIAMILARKLLFLTDFVQKLDE